MVEVDEHDAPACGEPAATSAIVSGTSGCGTSAIERPGSSSAEKKVPSTNAVSVGSARKSASLRSHFSHLSMSGSQSSLRSGPRTRNATVSESSSRCGTRIGGRRGGRGVSANSTPGCDFADRDVLERDEPAPGPVLAQEARHRRRAVDRDASCSEDLAAELREAEVVADVRVRQEDRRREARRAPPSARRSRAWRRSGSACRRPGRRGRGEATRWRSAGSRRASTQSGCRQPACGTPPSCAMPRTIGLGPGGGGRAWPARARGAGGEHDPLL